MLELNGFYNMDCMDGMKEIPNKYFDLAIVDPPYFEGPNTRGYYGRRINKIKVKQITYPTISTWDKPDEAYYNELFRVSAHQIIWGCNYFDYSFGHGRIIWDKVNGNSTFSDCEIAYCSIHNSVRIFRFMWNGMMQGKSITEGHIMQGRKEFNEKRIHPTQKPVALYKWLLMKYAKPGDKILDTHVGSASSLIACYYMGFDYMGFDYMGFEIDRNMYEMASARLESEKTQLRLEV